VARWGHQRRWSLESHSAHRYKGSDGDAQVLISLLPGNRRRIKDLELPLPTTPTSKSPRVAVLQAEHRVRRLHPTLAELFQRVLAISERSRSATFDSFEGPDSVFGLSETKQVYAGAIIETYQRLFRIFSRQLGLEYPSKLDIGPRVNGVSLTIALCAGTNNAKHFDEWGLENQQTQHGVAIDNRFMRKRVRQQMKNSMQPLSRIFFNDEAYDVSGNSSASLLLAVSDGKFETLEARVFETIAQMYALHCELIDT
jgi:hypothetical protein